MSLFRHTKGWTPMQEAEAFILYQFAEAEFAMARLPLLARDSLDELCCLQAYGWALKHVDDMLSYVDGRVYASL